MVPSSHTTTTTSQVTNFVNLGAPMELLIDDVAFEFYKYARDYRNDEIALFGVTKPENPLHVTKFVVTKQKVNSVAADMDEDYLALYEGQMAMQKIMPINASRVWAHTHPMTGPSSANPSGKDMGTWNDEKNKFKNFFVMLILSRSGEITCRVRVRGSLSSIVTGLDNQITIEREIPVKIVPTEGFTTALTNAVTAKFSAQAVTALGNDAHILNKYVSFKDMYPDMITEFEKNYAELVSPTDTYSKKENVVVGNGYSVYDNDDSYYWQGSTHTSGKKQRPIGFQHQITKKRACAEIVPEILMALGKDAVTFKDVTQEELSKLQERYDDIASLDDLKLIEDTFRSDRNGDPTIVDALLGAIAANVLAFENKSLVPYITFSTPDDNKRKYACNSSRMSYPEFRDKSLEFNQASLN